MCPRVAYRVSPAMTPRASLRQCGANRPEKAGTNTTSPLSGTDRASASTSDASAMIPRLSRSQPIERPRDRDGALERVGRRRVAEPGRDGRDQPVTRGDRLLARVHEHETAGAVGALELARLEAGLSEQRRLLVAEVAGDRDAGRSPTPVAVDLGRGADLGQHRRAGRPTRRAARAPRRGIETHQHRPRGVRTSVTWTPPSTPPVSCQISHESMVPNRSSPASAAARRSGPPASRIQASLSAEE